jgi:hypothetical protein
MEFDSLEPVLKSCPYCGEPVEIDVDESGGSRQVYVEDCPVCCNPWQVEVTHARDGEWRVTLRTSDE